MDKQQQREKMDHKQLKIIHMEEQVWMAIKEEKENVARIAEIGPQCDRDMILMRRVLAYTVGRILKEEADECRDSSSEV